MRVDIERPVRSFTALPLATVWIDGEELPGPVGTFERSGLLEAADHGRSTARTGGTGWFLTSVRFLDEIAQTLEFEIQEVIGGGVE
jgi:hypothetical protein